MEQESVNERLSRISTIWTVMDQAHKGPPEAASAARELLLQRYGPAVRRYLLGALRDPDAADDLTQEFALSLVRGEFKGADPTRGRFRNYVRSVLIHLLNRYRKRELKRPRAVPANDPVLAGLCCLPEDRDAEFRSSWRHTLLDRANGALADAQPVYHAVLRCRRDHPEARSAELARRVGERLGRTFTADNVRQTLHRARELFADLLLNEVAQSLENPTLERVEEELCELELLDHCRPALQRWTA